MMLITTTAAAAALSAFAIVSHDQTALRAAPRESAPQQSVLWQGDALEIRGARMDYLQVYDHRRERAGFVLASQVRTTSALPTEAAELLSVLRFVRDTPGAEALGVGYAAAYLKAAPATAIGAEPFDALGTMAERLARRASSRHAKADDARAALGLTRHDCVDPALQPQARFEFDRWRADVLDRMDTSALPETLKNRLHLRRAGVWSALAFAHTRRLDAAPEAARAAAERALRELAAVNKTELSDDDQADFTQAAIRTGASRWAAEPLGVASTRLAVTTVPGQPGETCVLLTDARHGVGSPLLRRCTWGTVWAASASASAGGDALALAVQPLAGWRELWMFRRRGDGWSVDVLPPAPATSSLGSDLGYVEFAGWVPGGERVLLARESRVDGRSKRSFEVVNLATMAVEKQASTPALLVLFGRWQDARWKQQTVSVR